MDMEATSDIFLLSHPDLYIKCPFCDSGSLNLAENIFQGIHFIGKYNCTTCTKSFFQTLPTGHDLDFPISFDESGELLKTDTDVTLWFVRPLLDSLFKEKRIDVTIEKEVFRQTEDAIILNCLDDCFGHAFAKLWNFPILKARYPNKSIIMFLPKRMRWLVPDGVDEVWSFNASFVDLENLLTNLGDEVRKNLLPRFSSVFASKSSTHLGPGTVDLKAFLKTERFDLNKFGNTPPRITFVLREDRFWHPYRVEFFLFKVFVKLQLAKNLFVWRQNFLVDRAVRRIKKKLANAEFYATGLNRTGKLSSVITDLRMKSLSAENERQWCDVYSKSHIVIGVHGSNMLIPSALSGGFIEILPRDKIKHIAEDTLVNHSSRYTHFLGRHLDHFVSPALVSQHAISMLKDFDYVYRNALWK